jgi:hypothetical protein
VKEIDVKKRRKCNVLSPDVGGDILVMAKPDSAVSTPDSFSVSVATLHFWVTKEFFCSSGVHSYGLKVTVNIQGVHIRIYPSVSCHEMSFPQYVG